MPAKQANVILIIMDDLTWGDLNCHGNTQTQTPNLDRLYRESSRLEQYRSGTVCTPARAAIMTGRHPYRTRAIDTYSGRSMIDPEEQTIASYLQDADYRTCLSGKWHLGDSYPNRPIDMGFEECLMHLGGGLCQPANYEYGSNDYFDPVLVHNGHRVRTEGFCTDIFTDHSMNFIRRHKDDPFFVYLATNAPHGPFLCPDKWSKRYEEMGLPEKWANLYGMVDNIDYNIGRIRDLLEELALTDDTILIFTSDHGACPGSNIDGEQRYNADLRGQKGSPYDGGVRVPCFWHWPDKFPVNKASTVNANPIDVFPTLKKLLGLVAEPRHTLDGVDLSEQLCGSPVSDELKNRFIPMQWHRGDVPVKRRNFLIVQDQFKCCADMDGDPELYNIHIDPKEAADMAEKLPDKLDELLSAYDDWFDDVSHTRPDNYAPPAIVAGTPHENPVILNRNDWRVHGQDGWNLNIRAHWEIALAEAADYEITCEFEASDEDRKVSLSLAGESFTADLPAGESDCVFKLNLPAADTQLEAIVKGSEADQSPRFVIIRHCGHEAVEIKKDKLQKLNF